MSDLEALRIGLALTGSYCTYEKALAALTAYADNFGLAFQITDDILDVIGDDGEQFVGKVARSQTAASCAEDAVVKVGGADCEGACMRLTVSGIAGIAVYGQ